MKTFFKKALLIITTTVLALGCGITAFAETKTDELITLDKDTNLAIVVGYDKEEPTVNFISPDDQEFKEGTQGVSLTRDKDGKKLYFEITNAKRGKWQIKYDKKSNTQLSVDFGKFSSGLWIESINIKSVVKNTLSASLVVSQKSDVRYQYSVYAVVLDAEGNIDGKKLLRSGSADANKPNDMELDISGLGSYDSYYLYAEVSFDDNGMKVSDEALSEKTFSYKNPDAPEAVTDLYAELDVNDNTLLISWRDYVSAYGDKIIAIYGNGETEPFYTTTADKSLDSIIADVDCTKLPFTLEFTYKDGNKISQTFKKQISLGNVTLDLKGGETQTSQNVEFDYNASSETLLEIVAGDKEPYEYSINGIGNFSVKLGDNQGDISISYICDNVKIIKKYSIFVDNLAPDIQLYLNGNIIKTTEKEFNIIGRVETGATLTLGTDKIETKENGDFSIKVSLNDGENKFDLEATDESGNKTQRQVVIIKTTVKEEFDTQKASGFLKSIVPFFIALGSSLLVAVVLILALGKKQLKTKPARFLLKGFMILSWVMTALSGGLLTALVIYKNKLYKEIGPEKLAETYKNSLDDAYDKITSYTSTVDYIGILKVVVIVTAVVAVLLTLLFIMVKTLSNKKPKPKKASKPKSAKPLVQQPDKPAQQPAKPAESKPEQKPAPKFCKKCGTPVVEGNKFCKKCGEKLF